MLVNCPFMCVPFFQIYDADKMPSKKSGNYSSLDNNPILRTLYDHIDVSLCVCSALLFTEGWVVPQALVYTTNCPEQIVSIAFK